MKYINKFIFSVLFLLLMIPFSVDATSGACSWHGGVDCDKGMQSNGKVYCNDGWTDSITYYEFTTKCQSNFNADDIIHDQLYYDGKIVSPSIDWDKSYRSGILVNSCSANSTPEYDYSNIGSIEYCKCDDGYYNYDTGNVKIVNEQCKKGEPFKHYLIYTQLAADKINDSVNKINKTNYTCNLRYGNSFLDSDGNCECKTGYRWIYAAYEKIIMCVKRDDYDENVVKNATSTIPEIPEGALIKTASNPDIYIVKYVGTKKFKRLVLSPSVFNNYGHLRWEDVMDVSQSTLDSFTTSELVRASGDDRIYRLYPQGDTGQKRMIKNNNVLSRLGLDPDSIYEINSFDREFYITGLNLE